jgi:hypothetical protein
VIDLACVQRRAFLHSASLPLHLLRSPLPANFHSVYVVLHERLSQKG